MPSNASPTPASSSSASILPPPPAMPPPWVRTSARPPRTLDLAASSPRPGPPLARSGDGEGLAWSWDAGKVNGVGPRRCDPRPVGPQQQPQQKPPHPAPTSIRPPHRKKTTAHGAPRCWEAPGVSSGDTEVDIGVAGERPQRRSSIGRRESSTRCRATHVRSRRVAAGPPSAWVGRSDVCPLSCAVDVHGDRRGRGASYDAFCGSLEGVSMCTERAKAAPHSIWRRSDQMWSGLGHNGDVDTMSAWLFGTR